MNVVTVIGRLGQNPQTRYTQGGKAVANFSVAVDNGFGEQKTTSWVNVVAWEKIAESVQKYVHKGDQVGIMGRLQQREWQDRNGGKHSVLEVVASQIDFLTKREPQESEPTISDEDIPF